MLDLGGSARAQEEQLYKLLMSRRGLGVLQGTDVALNPWGVRIRTTECGAVYLARRLFGWRIIEVPRRVGSVRAWCYDDVTVAVGAAVQWEGRPGTEPTGWIKSVHDGRMRPRRPQTD